MMDLDEAIQHCKEQVQEQAKKGCYSCAEEHQQLAEWLTELKAYKEQRSKRMNEAEKERLIKKDIESIENRVRHAFNQGYEIGLKESRSEFTNTCGDAISRQAVLEGIRKLYPDIPIVDIMGARRKWLEKYAPYFECENVIEQLPSVTPQQKIGYWEWIQYDECCGNWHCSECRTIIPHMPEETDNTPIYKWCPMCGAKMEVEE